MGAELPAQMALRLSCSGQNHQAARVPIQAMHRPQSPSPSFGRQKMRKHVHQGLGQKRPGAFSELGGLVLVPNCGQSRRLVSDNNVIIDVEDLEPLNRGLAPRCSDAAPLFELTRSAPLSQKFEPLAMPDT